MRGRRHLSTSMFTWQPWKQTIGETDQNVQLRTGTNCAKSHSISIRWMIYKISDWSCLYWTSQAQRMTSKLKITYKRYNIWKVNDNGHSSLWRRCVLINLVIKTGAIRFRNKSYKISPENVANNYRAEIKYTLYAWKETFKLQSWEHPENEVL